MKKEIIFLQPYFVEKIWGGARLKKYFNLNVSSQSRLGEAWLISGLDQGMSYVKNGSYKGYSLKDLYLQHPSLFNFPKYQNYPLLTKILDANEDLSVQIHPDDKFAKRHNLENGKTECWYILDCNSNASVIYGHHLKDKAELIKHLDHLPLEDTDLKKIVDYKIIEKGSFIYVPALKVHALLAGTMAFELQQSSDTTYRLFDYNRKDLHGNKRELHLDVTKELITTPDTNSSNANSHDNYLVDNDIFKLVKILNTKPQTYHFPEAPWLQVTVIQGNGKIDNTPIKAGDSFILPYQYNEFLLRGNLLMMLSYI